MTAENCLKHYHRNKTVQAYSVLAVLASQCLLSDPTNSLLNTYSTTPPNCRSHLHHSQAAKIDAAQYLSLALVDVVVAKWLNQQQQCDGAQEAENPHNRGRDISATSLILTFVRAVTADSFCLLLHTCCLDQSVLQCSSTAA